MAELLRTTYPYNIVGLTAVAGISLYAIRRYFGGGVCYSKARLDGKTAIITGANTGIGLETAVDFAQRNGRVILACRSKDKGEAAVELVKKRSGNNDVLFMQLDLSSLESVRNFSARVLDSEAHIDILVNNAGVMACPYTKTADGFEMQFGVNHLGHFLLTNLLLDRMKEAPSARIVNVSSSAHRRGKINLDDLNSTKDYNSWGAYAQSKLANILFTRSLATRLEGTNVIANALHPGVIKTELGRHINVFLVSNNQSSHAINLLFLFLMQRAAMTPLILFLKTTWQGAQTSIYCAVSEEMEGVSGQFLADCKIVKSANPLALDDNLAERLWEVSSEMVGLNN